MDGSKRYFEPRAPEKQPRMWAIFERLTIDSYIAHTKLFFTKSAAEARIRAFPDPGKFFTLDIEVGPKT